MEPTLQSGQTVLLRQEQDIAAGQIIFFRRPSAWGSGNKDINTLVKRVIAVPGDTLSYDGKNFLVNGSIAAPVSKDCRGPVGYQVTLNNKQVVAMGDNVENSYDSRTVFCSGKVTDMFIPRQSVVDYGYVVTTF